MESEKQKHLNETDYGPTMVEWYWTFNNTADVVNIYRDGKPIFEVGIGALSTVIEMLSHAKECTIGGGYTSKADWERDCARKTWFPPPPCLDCHHALGYHFNARSNGSETAADNCTSGGCGCKVYREKQDA